MAFLDQLDSSKYAEAAADIMWTHFGRDREVLSKIDSCPTATCAACPSTASSITGPATIPSQPRPGWKLHTAPENRLSASRSSWANPGPGRPASRHAVVPAVARRPAEREDPRPHRRPLAPVRTGDRHRLAPLATGQPRARQSPHRTCACRLAGRDPVEAMLWAQTISDPKRRASTEEQVAWGVVPPRPNRRRRLRPEPERPLRLLPPPPPNGPRRTRARRPGEEVTLRPLRASTTALTSPADCPV